MFPQEYLDNFNPKDHPGIEHFKGVWHSVASQIRSGYGTITRHITTRLFQLGYDIIVSAYYGIESGGVVLINNVPHAPCARHLGSFGEGSYKMHYKSFKRNCGILASDFWAFPWFPGEGRYSVMYSPMDHVQYAPHLTQLIELYDRVASFLPFQQEELMRYNIPSTVIPHGVDRLFKPMPREEARELARMPQDAFIVGIVSANSDKEMRKSWGEIFTAAEYIKKNYPDIKDIKYFCHTDPEDPKGVSLKSLAYKHGVLELFGFEDTHIATIGIPDNEMMLIYNCFDVLLCPSKREGFGLPILEAMACQKPVIAHDFSSMPDLVGYKQERGWLCKTAILEDTPIMATSAIPDYRSIANCILDAYNHPRKLSRKGKKAREFSQTMLWDDVVIRDWVNLFDSIAEEQSTKKMPEIARVEI